jgi:hypothetical protein
MSVVHELLNELEAKEIGSTASSRAQENPGGGFFAFDLPSEILNDFYDLKEYVRIANMRGQMRALSVTSSLPGEGSSTIATYLAYLFTGLAAKKPATADESKSKNWKNPKQKIVRSFPVCLKWNTSGKNNQNRPYRRPLFPMIFF